MTAVSKVDSGTAQCGTHPRRAWRTKAPHTFGASTASPKPRPRWRMQSRAGKFFTGKKNGDGRRHRLARFLMRRSLFRLALGGFNNLQFFDRDPHTSKGTWDLKTSRC